MGPHSETEIVPKMSMLLTFLTHKASILVHKNENCFVFFLFSKANNVWLEKVVPTTVDRTLFDISTINLLTINIPFGSLLHMDNIRSVWLLNFCAKGLMDFS